MKGRVCVGEIEWLDSRARATKLHLTRDTRGNAGERPQRSFRQRVQESRPQEAQSGRNKDEKCTEWTRVADDY